MQNQQSILYYAGIILWEKAEHWRSTIVTSHLGEFDAHILCSAKFRGSLITNFTHFQPLVKVFHWKLIHEPRISCKSIDEQHSRAMLPNLQGMLSKNIATHVAHPLFSCWYISTLHVTWWMSCSCSKYCGVIPGWFLRVPSLHALVVIPMFAALEEDYGMSSKHRFQPESYSTGGNTDLWGLLRTMNNSLCKATVLLHML